MSEQIVSTDLPPRLQDVLAEIAGSEHAPRFQLLFLAAANAIDVLVDLDFTRYEVDEQTHGEGLWDALAPAVEDTANSVEAFLECVRSLFEVRIGEPEDVDDDLDSWVEQLESRTPAGPAPAAARDPEQQLGEVTGVLQTICDGLTHELRRFRSVLAELQAGPDAWLLLDHIAMFRGKFRSGIGAMVYLAARLFLDVSREEVVPSYREDVECAVLLRRELARLREEMRLYRERLRRGLDVAALRTLLAGVGADLEAFCESPAYALVRAADKRPFGNVRRQLRSLIGAEGVDYDTLLGVMEGLTRFLESMVAISRREMLMIHDAEAGVRIEAHLREAGAALARHDAGSARQAVRDALVWCERLEGRDEQLDCACRVLRRVPLERLSALETSSVVRMLRGALEQTASG